MREARNAPAKVAPAEVHVEALPRPVFAYAWQLVDDGNGDGLVQRGEKYRLQVQVKNTGAGPTPGGDRAAAQRDRRRRRCSTSRASRSRQPLAPGQVEDFEFPLATDATLKGDEMVLELMAYDAALDVQASDKLHFKRHAGGRRPAPRRARSR